MSRSEIMDVGAPSRAGAWADNRWSRLPPQRRRAIVASIAAIALVVALVWAVESVRRERAERARQDLVSLSGTLDVSAESTAPGGGAVWFAVDLRNDGPLPVRITGLRGTGAGLLVRLPATSVRRLERVMPLEPGELVRLTLSARLICTERLRTRGTTALTELSGEVDAVPANGRSRTVTFPLRQARLLTDVADTTCRYRQDDTTEPGSVELSGPVAR